MRLTYLVDIAGRVARETSGAEFATAGGICLPCGAMKSIRKRLPSDLPKWRDASDADVDVVLYVLFREAFSATAYVCNKSTAQWLDFWAAADAVHRRTASLAGGSIAFLKAATQVKYLLLMQAASLTGAHAIRENRFPRSQGNAGLLLIEEHHIYDRELDGGENIAAFRSAWEARNSQQPLTASLGVQMRAESIAFQAEQDEPLLLLADYVAGIAQSTNSTTDTLRHSRVSHAAAQAAHNRLLRWNRYAEVREDFRMRYFDIFPEFARYAAGAA